MPMYDSQHVYSPTEHAWIATSPGVVPLRLKAAPGQTANLQEWLDGDSQVVASMAADGTLTALLDIDAIGDLTTVGDLAVTEDLDVTGNGVVGGTLDVTGALTAASADVTGALTADTADVTGALTAASATITDDMASDTATITDPDGLTVDGVIVPQVIEVAVNCLLNAACIDQAFFVANLAYQVVAVREVHAVAGDDTDPVSLQITKDTTTDAPGAGTDLLTNNTNVGFDLKATANTVQVGTLTATEASLQLAAGDRLSLDFAGVVATLAGLVVTVSLKRI